MDWVGAPELNGNSSVDELVNGTSERFVDEVVGDHLSVRNFYHRKGVAMRRLPFRSVAWVVGTNENRSMECGPTKGIPINAKFCEEFSQSLDLESVRSAPIGNSVREVLAAVRSRVTWWQTLVTGKTVF